MREIDLETWLMIGVSWFHGLLCGWAIWRRPNLKYKTEDEE